MRLSLLLRKKEKTLKLVNELKKRLKNSPNFRDYQNFILVDEQTRVILSLNDQLILPGTYLSKTDHSKNHILFELFNYTQQTKKPQLSPLTYFDLSKPPSIFIATPLGENQKNLSGVLMFQIANEALFELVQNFQGVGTTGETLIAFDIDSELIVFSSLYDKKRYPYIYRINPQSDFGKFILKVLKETPSIQYVQDYQGEMTIAVGKKVNPYTNWAIIAKVNQKELFSAVNLIRRFSWLILLVTAIVVTLLAIYVAKKLVTPLVQLTNTTKLMAKGDLSHRVYLPYNNEIGRLGLSFNEMAAQLEHLINHLDALVEKRTKEVEHKNEQLKTTIKELQETQHRMVTQEKLASLGGLTAGIAHEIKNPLNFINNFTELSIDIEENLSSILKEQKNSLALETKEELEQILTTLKLNLQKIYKHGKRADSIVHNMLQHSRGASSEKKETDLNQLLDEYVDLAFHGWRAKDSSFNVKIDKNYAAKLPPIKVSAQEISRVFLNLLNNAFYAVHERRKSSQEHYQPLVTVTTEEKEKSIIIKIWDNGEGIKKEVFANLFTPFFTTKPTGEGTGLGLSLSYTIIVQGHGGSLTAQSDPGSFTELTIVLPKVIH